MFKAKSDPHKNGLLRVPFTPSSTSFIEKILKYLDEKHDCATLFGKET